MANLKEVRTRIESVNSTKQITSAMKMVAASKLRKAQNSIMALRPYADKFSEILERIMADSQQPMANSQQPTTSSSFRFLLTKDYVEHSTPMSYVRL